MSRIAPILFLLACVGFVQTTFVKVKVTSAPSEPPEACTHYLSPAGSDTNSGTIRAPWKHLQKAFDTLTAGQVVCLRTGTYEPADAYNTPSYSHTISTYYQQRNPIDIRNYPREHAIVLELVLVR